jgi:hypothetical protein
MGYSQNTDSAFGPEDVTNFFYDIRDYMLGSADDDEASANFHPEYFNGDIQAIDSVGGTVTVKLTATSTKGAITQMKVWSGDRPPRDWVKFSKVVKLDLKDFAYARFKDQNGNISEKFVRNTHVFKN